MKLKILKRLYDVIELLENLTNSIFSSTSVSIDNSVDKNIEKGCSNQSNITSVIALHESSRKMHPVIKIGDCFRVYFWEEPSKNEIVVLRAHATGCGNFRPQVEGGENFSTKRKRSVALPLPLIQDRTSLSSFTKKKRLADVENKRNGTRYSQGNFVISE